MRGIVWAYQYSDIVIMMRAAKGSANTIVDHLKKVHIPAMYEGVPDFFGLAEVKAYLSLLTVIDNLVAYKGHHSTFNPRNSRKNLENQAYIDKSFVMPLMMPSSGHKSQKTNRYAKVTFW